MREEGRSKMEEFYDVRGKKRGLKSEVLEDQGDGSTDPVSFCHLFFV